MSSSRAKKVKMATKSCPECDQQVRRRPGGPGAEPPALLPAPGPERRGRARSAPQSSAASLPAFSARAVLLDGWSFCVLSGSVRRGRVWGGELRGGVCAGCLAWVNAVCLLLRCAQGFGVAGIAVQALVLGSS